MKELILNKITEMISEVRKDPYPSSDAKQEAIDRLSELKAYIQTV